MNRLRIVLSLLALPVLALPGGCIERPSDEMLRPPPQFQRALGILSEESRASSQRLAEQAQRNSKRLVQRSGTVTGPVLAQAILHAERQAARAGPQAIPEPMARLLAPHFSPALLKSVRWTTGKGRIDLGTFLTDQFMDEGAVALNRQIVFSSPRLTENLWIWAHELGHVEQYRRLGVTGFATAYVTNWQKMEREATARANAVTAAIRKSAR